MLGRGETTSQIRAVTKHSEHAIGRYQHDFSLVLYLLSRYPDAPDERRRYLSGLSRKLYDTYCAMSLASCVPTPPASPTSSASAVASSSTPTGSPAHRQLASATPPTPPNAFASTRCPPRCASSFSLISAPPPGSPKPSPRTSWTSSTRPFRVPESLRPGEVVFFADAHDPAYLSGEKVQDRPVIPVFAPLYTKQVQEIWRSDESAGRRRAQIATIIASAVWEQGWHHVRRRPR